jgi:hypothetical protein
VPTVFHLIEAEYRFWIFKRAVQHERKITDAYLKLVNESVRLESSEKNLTRQQDALRNVGHTRTAIANLGIQRDLLDGLWRQYFGIR